MLSVQARAVGRHQQGAVVGLRQTGQRLTSNLIPPLMGGIADHWGVSWHIHAAVVRAARADHPPHRATPTAGRGRSGSDRVTSTKRCPSDDTVRATVILERHALGFAAGVRKQIGFMAPAGR